MGWTFMALVLSHCIILYSVALVKRKLMCFAAGLITLASIKLEPYNSWQVSEWFQVQSLNEQTAQQCFQCKNTESLIA